MAANPKRITPQKNKGVPHYSTYLSHLTTVASLHPGTDASTLISDSAFLAERGILTRGEHFPRVSAPSSNPKDHQRRGQAA